MGGGRLDRLEQRGSLVVLLDVECARLSVVKSPCTVQCLRSVLTDVPSYEAQVQVQYCTVRYPYSTVHEDVTQERGAGSLKNFIGWLVKNPNFEGTKYLYVQFILSVLYCTVLYCTVALYKYEGGVQVLYL